MARTPDSLDGCVGEAWSGNEPDGSHINVVIARRGSATAASATNALACPAPGHAPVVVCLGAGNAVRPATILLNKATIASDLHGRITWGAAQLGVGQGVMDAVADGVLDPASADDLVLLVAAWVDPAAGDETTVRVATRDATLRALADAVAGDRSGRIAELLALRDGAANAFYSGS